MLLFIALLLHVFSGVASSNDSGEPSICSILNYSGAHNGSKYFLSNFYYMYIQQALDVCSSCGMYLVEVNDESEFRFVQKIARDSKTESLLLSGSDKIKEGKWVFPNNEPVNFKEWTNGAPDDAGTVEDYLAINRPNGYRMNDVKDEPAYIYRFLCERAINSEDVLDQVK
ncbi:perlucin-like [Physella acuta]|uniref:perlucin-like n=1 Tax=Physella acuta TaxID=109671 RepID=UPI0027DCE8CA|nr:perlucin-like [Physella acuta]